MILYLYFYYVETFTVQCLHNYVIKYTDEFYLCSVLTYRNITLYIKYILNSTIMTIVSFILLVDTLGTSYRECPILTYTHIFKVLPYPECYDIPSIVNALEWHRTYRIGDPQCSVDVVSFLLVKNILKKLNKL